MRPGPRIYNLFPLLGGTVGDWHRHLQRISDMQFDWVFLNPIHRPGFSGSLYAVQDYDRLNPLFRGDAEVSDDRLFADFVASAGRHGLSIMLDLVINHTSKDCVLVERHPHWYLRDAKRALVSPYAVDPEDPRKRTVWGDLAEIDYGERPERAQIIDYWIALVRHYVRVGVRGFRADAAYKVPSPVWQAIIAAARADDPRVTFAAETLGCTPAQARLLHDAGFDFLFNSAKWWDFRAPWLLEQYEEFRHIAPSIAFPESHDTERLASDCAKAGISDAKTVEAVYRQRYLFAATFSTGLMMPMGYEFGFDRKLDVVKTRPADWETPRFDLSAFIAETNRTKAATPALNVEGPQDLLAASDGGAFALLRSGPGRDWALTAINPDPARAHVVAGGRLRGLDLGSAAGEITPGRPPQRCDLSAGIALDASEVRVFASDSATASGETVPGPDQTRSTAIIIENVYPEVDGGRYPAKREVGDELEVWADIFKEGHDRLAAVVRYRSTGDAHWREAPMELVDPALDRWRGSFALTENARYLYTIEAWRDDFESCLADIEKKHGAGQPVGLELTEGRALVAAAAGRAPAAAAKDIGRALAGFDAAESDQERIATLTAPALRRSMRLAADRSRAVGYDRRLELTVDRVRARYGAWYEMFPRSQGTDPTRSATFHDCIARLDEIRDLGFDVVYLVPIHPIGRTHRKGRNNRVTAQPGEPGSPYAIGAAEGGHDAIHPDLGTLEDFRAFVAACQARGMEVALDLAVQCAPDHPWIKEHPEWFSFRPDGTIRHAENPPKKYQDIVNLEFDGPGRESLWKAIRDIVRFWIDQGVAIFRVDNPHTKPVPFWEWLIRDIQARRPDVLFLSEAFTRPPMLKLLAKAGFSQSYTYFTWRNFKHELTAYAREVAQSDCREYLRPNFFANTPDILPRFLQTGGRPAFQIRLVLAATLSSSYGIYNGFELCEARAVPETEDYLDSEKYEYKVWDWDRAGNIKPYVQTVNRIRRENPALHYTQNLRFHDATDDNVIFYGKTTPDSENAIFVAVNLDPFEAHGVKLRFPLADLGIAADQPFEVEELLTGARHLWRGEWQTVRLDPAVNPAAILRIRAWTRVPFRTPSF